jgi:hypothetical protein
MDRVEKRHRIDGGGNHRPPRMPGSRKRASQIHQVHHSTAQQIS